MAFERALIVVVCAIATWFAIRRLIVPFLVWLLAPAFKLLSAKRTSIAASAALEGGNAGKTDLSDLMQMSLAKQLGMTSLSK